jgi:hypothetical protein
MATAEVPAMSAYSEVQAIGNTPLGGTYEGLSSRVYQADVCVRLAMLPAEAAAATPRVVAANVRILMVPFVPIGLRDQPRLSFQYLKY